MTTQSRQPPLSIVIPKEKEAIGKISGLMQSTSNPDMTFDDMTVQMTVRQFNASLDAVRQQISSQSQQTRELENLAMNIVHQIGDDLWERGIISVKQRQETNDLYINFTKGLLATARQQWVEEVRAEIEKKRAGQFEWDGMYTMACDDILALPSLSLTEPKEEK